MKALILGSTAVLTIVVVAAARSDTQSEMNSSTMISRLKVGQQVRVLQQNGGGFNIEIPNEQYIKNFERKNNNRKYVTSKITEIGSDFIVVSSANAGDRTIADHAIDVITKLPEIKIEADDDAKK
jgi:hypothetical protein